MHVNTQVNGVNAADAKVIIDGKEMGVTDATGSYTTKLMINRMTTVEVKVEKEMPGHTSAPWQSSAVFGEDAPNEMRFAASIKAVPFFTIKVTDGDALIKDADVILGNDTIGKSDESGSLKHDLASSDKQTLELKVSKFGHAPWQQKVEVSPGDEITADIPMLLSMRVTALSEAYGDTINLSGLKVLLDGKAIGTTDKKGEVRLNRKGTKGQKGTLEILAPGYLPAKFSQKVDLEGSVQVSRYFYSKSSEPVRVAFFRFASNTAGEDIGDIPAKFQTAFESQIKSRAGFTIVDNDKMMTVFKKSKLSPDKVKEKGWAKTELRKLVDVLVFGSVSKDMKGNFTTEVNFYSADGGVLFSQIATASNSGKIDRAAKEIGVTLEQSYPFSGMLVAKDDKDYMINMGNDNFYVNRGDQFTAMIPSFDNKGKIKSFKEVGTLKVVSAKNKESTTSLEQLDQGATLEAGAKVVRKNSLSSEGQQFATVLIKSETRGEIKPVGGVNVYLDGKWIGTTNESGKTKISLILKKKYALSLYKHGFSQTNVALEVKTSGELKEFTLDSYNALLKVDSTPSGAAVFVDEVNVGTTPMLDEVPVSSGFHTIRISAGGNYRDWEEVFEFSTDEVNWTGENVIKLYPDFLKQGQQALTRNDVDGAINLFSQAPKDHPDYADIHLTLGNVYLDTKNDPTNAVAEFEKVLAIPEIRELVFKQYAVAYTNIGHAYHVKADSVLHTDKKEAATNLSKAIQILDKARENARFFPSEHYDEAIHDTYYYIALSYHKLYQLTNNAALLNKTELAWRDYMDFFPESLQNKQQYVVSRQSAERFMEQLKAQ
ncbi:MAG: PEGA domain-containing protein [Gammaproteobacteria bacterium]|nr:PEGA domain-containing protein [Gammaproteobacteria bacterium]